MLTFLSHFGRFERRHPIHEMIDQFVAYKSLFRANNAGQYQFILKKFVNEFQIRSIEDVDEHKIALYAGEQFSDYYQERVLIALRAFLRYCRQQGIGSIPYQHVTMKTLNKVGRPKDLKMRDEVQALRKKGMSFRKITATLQEKYRRPFYLGTVHSWSHQ